MPVLIYILWIPIALYIYRYVNRRLLKEKAGKLISIAVFIGVLLLPIVDEVLGRVYFSYLCTFESGLKVYEKIILPGEYWHEHGAPKFIYFNGNYSLTEYPKISKSGSYSKIFHIDHAGYSITRKSTGKVMGEVKDYRYWGGWLRREFSLHNTANSCGQRKKYIRQMISELFVKDNINQEK